MGVALEIINAGKKITNGKEVEVSLSIGEYYLRSTVKIRFVPTVEKNQKNFHSYWYITSTVTAKIIVQRILFLCVNAATKWNTTAMNSYVILPKNNYKKLKAKELETAKVDTRVRRNKIGEKNRGSPEMGNPR